MLKLQIDCVKKEVFECATRCGRSPEEIKLIAVTKTHPVSLIKEALENGIDYIAESKVQEAEGKIPELKSLYKEFHFIGHLQSNKINKLLALNPVLIHSIDKYSTAKKLNEAISLSEIGTTKNGIDILIEVNTSGEESKNGIKPSECLDLIKQIDDLEYVKVRGLMTIGALTNDEKAIRKCFVTLRELFEKAKSHFPETMKYLSMGMSGDFKIAIEEGSNMLRLGSILFGEKNYL